jgi:histone H3/H4
MHEVQTTINKKKKTKYFEIYICKILKTISNNNGITSNAKQQLNSIICSLLKIISDLSIKLVKISNKKTINICQIFNSLKIILPEQFLLCCDNIGNKSLEKYTTSNIKGLSRQKKSDIIFPPSIVEKFLRNSDLMVSVNSTIYLASIIEYLTYEILENAIDNAKLNKHVRITIRDIELGVRNDKELNTIFVKNNLTLLGGGVIPYIHPELLLKNTKNNKKNKKIENSKDFKKKHKFKPGTVSLRDIRKFQKIGNLLTCTRLPFEKLIRNSIKKINNNIVKKINKEIFIILQYFIEQKIVNMLKHCNMITIHSSRIKVTSKDINLVYYIKNNTDNFYNSFSDYLDIKKIDDLCYIKNEVESDIED